MAEQERNIRAAVSAALKQQSLAGALREMPETAHERLCVFLLRLLAALPALTMTLTALSKIPGLSFLFFFDLCGMMLSIGYLGLILAVYTLLWTRTNRPQPLRERLRGNGLPFCLLAMLVWSCLSCLLSTDPELSFLGDGYRQDGLASYFAYAGIFFMATRVRKKEDIRSILRVLTASAALLALVGLLNVSALNELCEVQPGLAVFHNQNHYGYFLSMTLPASVWLFTDARGARMLLHAAEATLLANGLINCSSMGPLLAVLCSFLALLILVFIRERQKFRRTAGIVCLCLAAMAASAFSVWNIGSDFSLMGRDFATLLAGLRGNAGKESLDRIGSGRGVLWINALRFITERPVFGYGPDNLGEVYRIAGCASDRPHNELLQFAASLGIPAAAFYVGGLACLLAVFIRRFRSVTAWEIGGYAVIGSYLVSSLFGNTMYYTTPFYFMLLGLCFAMSRQIGQPVFPRQEHCPKPVPDRS